MEKKSCFIFYVIVFYYNMIYKTCLLCSSKVLRYQKNYMKWIYM